jgi:hypothetical protein
MKKSCQDDKGAEHEKHIGGNDLASGKDYTVYQLSQFAIDKIKSEAFEAGQKSITETMSGGMREVYKSGFDTGRRSAIAEVVPVLGKAIYARFWSKVKVLKKRQCWEWQPSVNSGGYGRMSVNGKPEAVHRISFEYFNGPIPNGLWIDHTCMNRKCVNPYHLRAVTPQVSCTENTNGTAARNKVKTHCPRGHEFSKENTRIGVNGDRRCKRCESVYDSKRKRARRLKAKLNAEVNNGS